MKFSRILLLIVVFLSAASLMLGDNAVTAESLLSQPNLAQPKRLTVALVSDIKPYQFYEQQQVQGYIADWWRLWGQANGYEIEFKMTTGQNSVDLVVHGQADLHGGIENVSSLATEFYFSKPIISIQSELFLTRDVISTKLIESLYPYVVGVIKGAAVIDMLATQYPKFKLMIYSSRHELLEAVKKGQVKIIAAISTSAFSANEFSTLFPQTKRISLFSHLISVGVLKSNQQLINLVEQGRSKVSQAALHQLSRKWFSTKRNNATLMLSTSLHYAPFAAISPEGKPFGYLIELWELWSKKNNISIDFMPSYRTDILNNVRSGAADLTLSYPVHQKTADLIKGRKMATIDVGLFYYTDKFKQLTLQELAGRRIGYDSAVMGSETLNKLRLLVPDSQLMPLNSVYELINSVRGGDVAAIMMTSHFGQATLNYLNLGHQFKQVINFNYGLDIFIWANKKTAPLLPEIDHGFDAISQAELNQLAAKWFSGSGANPKRALGEISSQEKDWIGHHRDIRFGYVKSRVPFEYIDQQNNMDGINRTTLDLIAAKTRLNFTFHPYLSMSQLLKAIKDAEVDVISSVYEYSSNWSDFKLTQPYWDSSIAVISRDGKKFDQLSQLQGKVIAVNTNSSHRQYLLKMLADVTLVDVDDMTSGVEVVTSGEADIYIGNILIAVHEIRDKAYEDFTLSIIDSAPRANPRFVVRADWLPLVKILDKAVLKISDSERLTLLGQWLNHSLNGEAKYQDLLGLIVPVSVIALLVFYCFIYWNSRLRDEIKLRLALQKKLEYQARHDDLTGIPNRAWLKVNIKTMLKEHQLRSERLLCLFIDLDGFKAINDSYGHDVGDLLLVQFCRRLTHHLRHGDFVSRFGGDEFVILASLKDPERGSEAITKMVHQIYQDPIMIDHLEIKISCSIGAAVFPQDGTTFEQLIKKADQRMYRQKNTKEFDNITKVRFRVDE